MANILLEVATPTLADVPLAPILWSIIGVLVTMLGVMCAVVVNIVKSRFSSIEQNMEKFQSEILKIKNDIVKLQHGQDIFNKDLQMKDLKIELIREQNKNNGEKK